MKNPQALLNRLEAQVREDLDSQRRVQSILDALAGVVRSGSPVEIAGHFGGLKREIQCGSERATRRTTLFQALAVQFGVPTSMVTLSSIAERAGPAGEQLCALRLELRAAAALVVRTHRKLAATLRCQRRILNDALAILLSDKSGMSGESGNPLIEEGTLVDASV